LVIATLLWPVLTSEGPISGFAALAIGLANSIMFPTIFTITPAVGRIAQCDLRAALRRDFGGAILPMSVG
jgi:FHS family L-fucose permease-like MFS transporter